MTILGIRKCAGLIMAAMILSSCAAQTNGGILDSGVSLQLARWRSEVICDVEYDIHFAIIGNDDIKACESVAFTMTRKSDLVLDFAGERAGEVKVSIDSAEIPVRIVNEHIVLPAKYLVKGRNVIDIEFFAGTSALNRREDYVYTLFVPDRARTVFPCFDQPDIKARFALTLDIPGNWKAVSNAPLADTTSVICQYDMPAPGPEPGLRRWKFTLSDPLPTYLFAFAAGEFEYQYFPQYRTGAFYRGKDEAETAQIPEIAREVGFALDWLEDYTAMPYPFAKYDFVVLPGFQFGGMEHAGATFYNDTRLFLSANPTPDEKLRRIELIAHETAHMWFGDAVTMKWFNDVWTKEVFANYFAAAITDPLFPEVNHELNFLRTYKAAAMAQDRTEGRTAIRQSLDNMNNAGLVYNNIIYNKAPVMMRKLASMMGEDAFKSGIREYLAKFKYGNATWDDLIAILSSHTDNDVAGFSRTWVDQSYWPEYQVSDTDELEDSGTYGFLKLACSQAKTILESEALPADPVRRLSLIMNLNENYLRGIIPDADWMNFLLKSLSGENDDLIAASIVGYMSEPLMRMSMFSEGKGSEAVELSLMEMSESHHIASVRTLLLRLLSKFAASSAVVDELYSIWSAGNDSRLSQPDYMTLAYELAVRFPEDALEIIDRQRTRLTNPDVRDKFDFISRAVNPSEEYRDSLFASLSDVEARRIEPWTQSLLYYLNHPLRSDYAVKYIVPALELLPEIQRTGDIFFPAGWCSNLIAGHRSDKARIAVHQYLDNHPELNPMLRSKILQASFGLDR
ncbi:MAG: M1 family metallopeptidase [Candidatus Cryptobacteroides sp.]